MKETKEIPTASNQHWLLGAMPQFVPNPPAYLARQAAEHGDIVQFRLFNYKIVMPTHPDLIQEVLVKRAAEFPKDPRDVEILSRFIGHGLVTAVGEEHKKQRKMAQPAFHGRRIQAYTEAMTQYAAELIEEWSAGETKDMAHEMEKLTMYIVVKTLFDLDKSEMADQADEIGEAIKGLQLLTNKDIQRPFPLPTWLPVEENRRRKQHRQVLNDTISTIIRGRRGEEADRGDLLSMFLQARYEDGSELTDEEILDQMVTIFVAGHETTSNALSWTWYYLSQYPEIEAQLHQELDEVLGGRLPTLEDLKNLPYTDMVLKESMRIQPPVWILNGRVPTADTTIGDYPVKKGTMLFISPYAMHHHPAYFSEPERFDPQRFTPENEKNIPRYAYFPFGGGPRICIGNSFAMMEAKLILAAMAQKYRFSLDPDQVVEPIPLVTVAPKYGLKMQAVPRAAATPDFRHRHHSQAEPAM